MLISPSQSVDAPRQSKKDAMIDTVEAALNGDPEFLTLKDLADFLHLSSVTVYRLVARRLFPVYRASRKMLFKKQDVLEYLERHRKEPASYGRPEG